METGDYETNTLVINNIASIAYRIYEPSTEQSQTFISAAPEIESLWREQGHIVSYDANRRGLWLFQIIGKDDASDVVSRRPDTTVEGHSLSIVEEGSFEPSSLQKSRTGPPNQTSSMSTSSNASVRDLSQRSQAGSATVPEPDSRAAPGSTNDPKSAQVAQKAIYEQFVAAIVSSVSLSFCSQVTALPLNYRTVLIPPSQEQLHDQDDPPTSLEPVLGTFRTYLTTTGSLVISLGFSSCQSLSCLDDVVAANLMPPNRPILAAPFGVLATKQPLSTGETSGNDTALGQTPNTQALSVRGIAESQESAWKQTCLRALELCGLDVSAFRACSWINLLVSRRFMTDGDEEPRRSQAYVPWPGPLCFRKKSIEVSATSRVGDTMLSGHEECHDPLGNARGWFSSAPERDDKVVKRKAERITTLPKEPAANEVSAQKVTENSPFGPRRPSTAAAGVMYPTPPDAIQPVGVTPSMDGTISSPGNPPTAPAVVDIDTSMPPAAPAVDSDQDAWNHTSESKEERSDHPQTLENSENVFGEMGGDMFGDNDITEDDFNFFDDEQPGDADMDITMEDIPDSHIPPPPPQPPPESQEEIQPPPSFQEQPAPPPKLDTDDGVFAKPELKHARSMNESTSTRSNDERQGSVKRESSPFDPDTVFKRVKATLTPAPNDSSKEPQRHRRMSVFEEVSFDPKLPLINKKYQQGGPFEYRPDQGADKVKSPTGPLEAEFLKRRGLPAKKLKALPLPAGSLVKAFMGLEAATSHPSPTKPDGGFISDLDDSDMESDGDSSMMSELSPMSPNKSSLRRNYDDDMASQVTSLRDLDTLEDVDEQMALELPRLSKPEHPELPLYKFFSDPEPLAHDFGLSDDDLVQVAQLITEQAATGFLQIGAKRSCDAVCLASKRGHEFTIARNSLEVLRKVVNTSLGVANPSQFKKLLEVQDIPLLGQPNRLQPRPVPGRDPNSEQFKANSLYQIPGPHLEVRRTETRLSVLPSAVSFWESLGLAPSQGVKDIHALCVFPDWKGMADHVNTFLSRMKSVYESLKLGTFNNMALSGELTNGILPYEVDRISTSPDATITGHGSALVECLEALRTSLEEWEAKEKNLVVFFVYSPDNPGSIVEACASFQRCFDMYKKMLTSRREKPQNELVMQLISADFLSSPTGLVVAPPAEFIRLSIETYDRCVVFPGRDSGSPSPAPAIMLEQPLPRMIDFKLTSSPSASPLHENSCIHVAYAQSVDDRWVTAAWTDNRGYQQATASYCLSRKGKPPSTALTDIAHEIWLSTLELISVWKVHWRIIITKAGPMDPKEIEFWIDLARTESKATVTLSLTTVDTSPSVQLIPPAPKVPPLSTAGIYSTPVSTPQASIVSPEQITTPATPMRDPATTAPAQTPGAESAAEPDADALVVDVTDQTWGAVAAHRLSTAASPLEARPALVSGYLVKRTGPRAEDAPALMEVNLVHTEAQPRAYEPLFREMLAQFRGLGTLARARGVVDRETDVRPWHVAAAEKGVRALYLLL